MNGRPIVAWIDNKRVVFDEDDLTEYNDILMVTIGNREFYLFIDENDAGEEARKYWEHMAYNDPREFRCIVGDEALVNWCLGQPYAVGNESVSTLDEWLDLWVAHPEEHWASYDGKEREFKSRHPEVDEYTIAYRCN